MTLAPSVRIFLAVAPFNMHGSYESLAGAVRRLHLNPLDGHLYVFLNARRTSMKILFFDRSGYCVYSKRLAQGTFELPVVPPGATQVGVDSTTLAMILEGVDLAAPRRLRYREKGASR